MEGDFTKLRDILPFSVRSYTYLSQTYFQHIPIEITVKKIPFYVLKIKNKAY